MLMRRKVEEFLDIEDQQMASTHNNEEEKPMDDFMDVIFTSRNRASSQTARSRAHSIVEKWLQENLVDNLDDSAFLNEKVLKELFIR